jgi:AraC family transcriptional regulator
MEKTMTVTPIERPTRKLILVRSCKATDYFSFCEEIGCDWEGLLGDLPGIFDAPALLTLPPNLVKPGTGKIACGVEVPLDTPDFLPDGCDAIELNPCVMLYFQGAPFEDENDFGLAIETLWEQMAAYQPARYGWQYAPKLK